MSSYLQRAQESARSHAAHVAQVAARVEAAGDAADPLDVAWLAQLREEQERREHRVLLARAELAPTDGGQPLPTWPAADRARFTAARDQLLAALVRANPRARQGRTSS